MVIVTQGGDGRLHHNLAHVFGVPIAVRHSPPLLLLYTLAFWLWAIIWAEC